MSTNKFELKQRYTALWAFSESILGGILHAFKIPFTGLILGGFAVVFLTLLSDISPNKKDLLKVTSVVLLIKFMLSPNTPFTAHLAVFMQGFFAFVIFSLIRNRTVSIFLLSFLSSMWSASQKIVVTTLIFGMTFWYSIDEFTIYLAKIFGLRLDESFSFSLILILSYYVLHLFGAFFFSKIAIYLPKFLEMNKHKADLILNYGLQTDNKIEDENKSNVSKRKKWYKKTSRIILLTFFILLASITYLNPEWSKIKFVDVLSMIFRAIILIYLWFKVISPILTKIFFMALRKNSNLNHINEISSLFPEFKRVILLSWKFNSSQPKLKRIKYFFEDILILLLR
ncbi:MAG: hypothetical protein N3F03_06655 [Ignavibacteria bacterium]|nr:hypothetical protein [Ignavibacteria bacterium]